MEQEFTLAMPAGESDPLVDGSERRNCNQCDQDVWVTPATQRSVDDGLYPDRYLCTDCAEKQTGPD